MQSRSTCKPASEIRGRENITAWRQAYPGRASRFTVERCIRFRLAGVVELVMHIDGEDPHHVAAILDFDCDRIYIAEPWPAPAYRAAWAEPID